MELDIEKHPHRRHNPLTGDWVLVSPHRLDRPWQGATEGPSKETRQAYNKDCYLCPGNTRAGGVVNPDYRNTFVFDNDFAALLPDTPPVNEEKHPLLTARGSRGIARVICFSPHHGLTLPRMEVKDIRKVVTTLSDQIRELGKTWRWVQIFENRGEIMGCSNPHPHCQAWATDYIPVEPAREDIHQKEYYRMQGTPLLLDYLALEENDGSRLICANAHWTALVPYWATWPFESILLPRRHVLRLTDLSVEEQLALAEIMKQLLTRYDNLFHISFPYSMGWHNAPTGPELIGGDKEDCLHWQLHAHYYPPLLRSATVKKFMVGYEMLAEAQRDLTPEQAAATLRVLSDTYDLT